MKSSTTAFVMDNSSVDPIGLLDQMESVVRLRWDDLNKKCKSLEESLIEINSEKEHLKDKLALSQQRVTEIEQERDRLAQIVNDFHRDLLTSPLCKLLGKLRQGVNVLELSNNASTRSVASNYNLTANYQPIFDTSIGSSSFCSNVAIPKIDEENENVCSSTESSAQCRAISSKDLDNLSYSTIRNIAEIRPENANSLKINESGTEKSYTPLNTVNNQTTTQFDDEDDVQIMGEDTNSDIELVLSDDENVEPPICDKKLVVCLPMIEFIPKEEPVSQESSDCDSGASNKSPLGCIVCEEIFLSEDDLDKHVKINHFNQYCELKKLAIDFREKPTLLPRLRSREKKSQISTDLRPRTRSKSRETKRSNPEENVEAVNFKKSEQLLPMDIENNPSVDIVPVNAFVETSVETVAAVAQFDTTGHTKSPLRVTADSSIKKNNKRLCLICKKNGRKKQLKDSHVLDNHILEEHPDSSDQLYIRCLYKGGTCRRHFTLYKAFKKHAISKHQEEILAGGSLLFNGISSRVKNYKCKICNEEFRNGKGLGYHLNRCHVGDERMETCSFCDHIFQNHASLLQHQRKIHPDKSSTTQNKTGSLFFVR